MKNKEIEIEIEDIRYFLNELVEEVLKISAEDIKDFEKDIKIKVKKSECLGGICEILNIKIKNLLLKKGKIQIVYEKI